MQFTKMNNSNNEEQIDALNSRVKVRIAPSPIHGIGLFAIRDIGKEQKLWAGIMPQLYTLTYSHFSKLFPEVRELLLERWPNIPNGSRFFYPDTFLQSYCNHSDDPNYDAEKDITLKDIQAGEEITEDYRKVFGYEQIYTWLLQVRPQKTKKVNKEKLK